MVAEASIRPLGGLQCLVDCSFEMKLSLGSIRTICPLTRKLLPPGHTREALNKAIEAVLADQTDLWVAAPITAPRGSL